MPHRVALVDGRAKPIAQCLSDMDPPDPVGAPQIRDRPSHPQYSGVTARRQPHRGGRLREQCAARLIRPRGGLKHLTIGFGITAQALLRITIRLDGTRGFDPRADLG